MLPSGKLTYLIIRPIAPTKTKRCHCRSSLHCSAFQYGCEWVAAAASWDCQAKGQVEWTPPEKLALIWTICAGDVSWTSKHSHCDCGRRRFSQHSSGLRQYHGKLGRGQNTMCKSSVSTAQKRGHLIPDISGFESCTLDICTARDCERKCYPHRTHGTQTVGDCEGKCRGHRTPCTATVGDCEGKEIGHRTPGISTVGDCGYKNPSVRSCPNKCPCHPKKANDFSSPATSSRFDGHPAELGRRLVHFGDVSKTNWCCYVLCIGSISTGQLGQGPGKLLANSWHAHWGDTRPQQLLTCPGF